MEQKWVISGLAFAAVVLLVESVYWLVIRGRGRQKAVNRRLTLSGNELTRSQVFEQLRRERALGDFDNRLLRRFDDFLVQTGTRLTWSAVIVRVAIVALLSTALLFLLAPTPLYALVLGPLISPLPVALYFSLVRSKRIGRFALQLPDSIDIIVRGLRIGHPFTSALELVGREMSDPIGTEFGMTADEIAFGQDIVTAVDHLYRRVGQEDLLFLGIAVSVQTQAGGNLADVLSRLSRLIRERVKLRLKIRALSAEGRMSAYFLSAMPFILFGIIWLMFPKYFDEIRSQGLAAPTLAYVLTSLAIANYVIYRMVNFRV